MEVTKAKINEYCVELDLLPNTFTLEQLINSHRKLRESKVLSRTEMLKENTAIYERTKILARQEVLHGEYVSIEKLKTMTLLEISNLVATGNM